jgi:hypothetical protein
MAGEERKYSEWIKRQPCHQCDRGPRSHQHHVTGEGLALRAHDFLSMPLCHRCHMAFHSLNGPFKGWDKARCAQWQQEAVVHYRSRFLDTEAF